VSLPAALPAELWLCKKEGEWPVQCFTNEAHVIWWLENGKDAMDRCHAWRVTLATATEVEYVPPGEAILKDRLP
jgi:hypothetical protein